jgi:DNA adenine methylase
VRSFLRWAGSKRLLVNELAVYWPADATRYVEPFAGSACLFFYVEPARALISDLNRELISMYQALQRDTELVLESFRRLRRGKKAYYSVREINPKTLSGVEAAARFLYLNRYCFNGLFRTNQSGVFNVPYGPPKRPLVSFEERVRDAANILKQAEFRAVDFEVTLDEVQEGDFVYLDPPYVVKDSPVFLDYLATPFTRKDVARLDAAITRIDAVGAKFLLSYADSAEARKLARKWQRRRVTSRRNIAGFVGARKLAGELLVTNMV